MAKTRKTRRQSSGPLSTIHPAAAGIDIGATCHVVAVPPDRDDRPARTFRSFLTATWLALSGREKSSVRRWTGLALGVVAHAPVPAGRPRGTADPHRRPPAPPAHSQPCDGIAVWSDRSTSGCLIYLPFGLTVRRGARTALLALWSTSVRSVLLGPCRALQTNMLSEGPDAHAAKPSVSKVRRSSRWRF